MQYFKFVFRLFMDMENNVAFDILHIVVFGLCFQGINVLCYRYELIPASVPHEKRHFWFNILLSLVHSIFGAIAWLFCFFVIPDYGLPSYLSKPGGNFEKKLVYVTLGYFAYDLVHTLRTLSIWKSKEIVFHHIWILWGFCIFSWGMDRDNITTIALASEINTMFIHIRKLLRLSRVSVDSMIYQINSWMNVATYIVFRFPAFGWMFLYLFLYTDYTQDIHYLFSTIGCLQMTVFNFVLFYKLVSVDYFNRNKSRDENLMVRPGMQYR